MSSPEVPPQATDALARGALSRNAIPHPTYHPPDPTKKSHARKQPEGHVPRPRNAFILFRCDFVRQKKVPEDVENDHRNISRIAGSVWRLMSNADKAPWVDMADQEKKRHLKAYPGYRYTPAPGVPLFTKRKKRGDVEEDEIPGSTPSELRRVARGSAPYKGLDTIATHVYTTPDSATSLSASTPAIIPPQLEPQSYLGQRRSSSCPPGAPRVPVPSSTILSGFASPDTILVTRDDLARRPSRITMFQSDFSLASSLSLRLVDPNLVHVSPTTAALQGQGQGQGQGYQAATATAVVKDVRPEMRTGAYVADLPGDVPGWDSAAVPLEWADTALFDLDAWGGGKKMSMSMDLSGLYDVSFIQSLSHIRSFF
ncbi:hypothetical protein DXG03_001292 [Asterophora parasitica]|uniref:HMG box domain-containing protein n=2 Tax=Asterophora parasitica TaxID=117018 RepID=A0A9P7GA19_9AGAR|nr:hypothetical protein DXG03_001292 [Asterophora parasitica]